MRYMQITIFLRKKYERMVSLLVSREILQKAFAAKFCFVNGTASDFVIEKN